MHWTAKGIAHLVSLQSEYIEGALLMGIGVVLNNDGILNDSIAGKCQR